MSFNTMKKIIMFMLCIITFPSIAESKYLKTTVGESNLNLPIVNGLVNAGELDKNLDTFFSSFTPSDFNYLGALITKVEAIEYNNSATGITFQKSIRFMSPKSLENKNITVEGFRIISKPFKGKFLSEIDEEIERNVHSDIKSKIKTNLNVDYDIKNTKQQPLGSLYETEYSVTTGIIQNQIISIDGLDKTVKSLTTVSIIKIKNKLVFMYAVALGDNEEDLIWAVKIAKQFIDSI